MARELGGALFPTPAKAPPTPAIGSDENAPPGDASDAARSAVARKEPGAASRPPLRAIQPPCQPRWLPPTPRPKNGLPAKAAGKSPTRMGAATTSLGPTKLLRKPLLRPGTGASASTHTKASRSKVQEAILFWEENRNVQNVSSILQQDNSHAPAMVENCSDEGFMRNSDDILCLQFELDIIKTILVEEIKAQTKAAEARISALDDELKAANLHILEAARQNENKQNKLNNAGTIIAALESELVVLINTSKELKNQKRELNSKLKKIQALLEKERARNFNIPYQQDQANHRFVEQGKGEICREAEIETAEVIISMEKQICQLESQLDKSTRCYEGKLKELEIQIQEMDDKVAASIISRDKEKEIAEAMKTYAEKKNEEVNLLERSIEDLEITVCSLENKVALFKEEAEQQRRKRENLEVELQNVRQQLLAVPSSEKADSSLDGRMVDLPYSNRHPSYYTNKEILGARESSRIGQNDVFGKESKILGPVQEGPTSSVTTHGCNMGMFPPFEEKMQGSHSSSSAAGAVELAVKPAPLVDHTDKPGDHSDEYMPNADQAVVDMANGHSSDKDYWLESSELEESNASEQTEQSSAKQPELYGTGADSDQSLTELKLEELVPPPAVEPVVDVLKDNELPPVASVRPNDPVNYTGAPSDELKKLRSRNHYEGQRTATDRRFWSIEQQDLYNSIYARSKIFDMKWIDWEHIDSIKQNAGVREHFANMGLERIMSYCCHWDDEVIRQFYSTVHISADRSSMTWMTNGTKITTNKRAWEENFGIHGGVRTKIHSQFLPDDDDKKILYTSAESLTPLASVANKILRRTIYPRCGSSIHGHNWNLLCHIVKLQPFDVIALIFGEIDSLISDRNRTKGLLLYAPYIMGMILRAFEYNGPRESRHHSYKPHSDKPKPTKKVSRPAARAAAASSEPPPSTFQTEVAAAGAGHDAHAEAADGHHQFEAARHQPQAEAVRGRAALPITRTDLLQVVEDRLRPIRVSLASMEGRFGRVDGGAALPLQHTNSFSSFQTPGPTVPSAEGVPSLQAPTSTPCPDSAASSEHASTTHADGSGILTQPALVRPSPFSRFHWYKKR